MGKKQEIGHDIVLGFIYSLMNGVIFSLGLSFFICNLEEIASLHVYSDSLMIW